jgi:GntR family transcriptional repressor for pyruvate dehydrogenase complex
MKRLPNRMSITEPKIKPVLRASLSDGIVEQIMHLIANGDLVPGQRLPSERELCIRFGTGRSSLREALRCLSIVGVLNARVGEGTSVASDGGKFMGKLLEWRLITEQHDVQNLMEVRTSLESLAAASAASEGSQIDLDRLSVILERMKTSQQDHKRFSALDLEFHLAIAKASNNPLLSDMVSMIRGQLAKGLTKVLMLPTALQLSYQEHLKIADKIRRRDSKGAGKAMSEHLQAGLGRYRKYLEMEAANMEASKLRLLKSAPRNLKQL